MRYKKLICLLACAVMQLPFIHVAGATATPTPEAITEPEEATVVAHAPDAPTLSCVADVLLCAENGQILLDKDGGKRLAPASITKLMTALVVLDNVADLSTTTTVSENAVYSIERGSTHVALNPDEVVTLCDMMGAMLVESANDASNVLAEHVGGSLEGFADMMNAKAREIGCEDTHFVNANGLDDPEHYTTARDMARIGQALTKYPEAFEYLGASVYRMEPTNKQPAPRQWWTKQNFLRKTSKFYDEYVLGGKNGWTSKAHQTLVTFRKQDGVTLVAVAMCAGSKESTLSDTAAMFAYGQDKFSAVTLSGETQAQAAQDVLPDVEIDTAQDTLLLLPEGVKEKELVFALSKQGDKAELMVAPGEGREPLLCVPLALSEKMPEVDGKAAVSGDASAGDAPAGEDKSYVPIVLAVAGVVALVFVLLCVYRWSRIRRNRRKIRDLRERARRHSSNGGAG